VTELARFWDTHDLTEFEDELEEVNDRVFDRGGQSFVRLCLRPEEAATLHRIAKSKGVDDTELVSEWVHEKLRAS
jgi:hypothetical protein